MQQQGQMHPEDKRNLIIFLICALAAYFFYDIFVHQPKMKALREQAAQEQAVQKAAATDAPGISQSAGSVLDETQALALSPRVAIDNPDLEGSLALKGGRLDDIELRHYFVTTAQENPVTLLAPMRTKNPMVVDFGWLSDQSGIAPDAQSAWQVSGANAPLSKDHPVTLRWSNGKGLNFERTYALDDQYMFTVTQSVTNTGSAPVTLYPYAAVTRQGLPEDFVKNAVMFEGPIGYIGSDLHEVAYKDLDKKPQQTFTGTQGWAGFTDKYWFSGLIPSGERTYRFIRAAGAAGAVPTYQVDMTGAATTIAPGASAQTVTHAYVGPKKLSVLNAYKKSLDIPRFDLVIDFGKLWFLTIPFSHVLSWLGHETGSFAIALLIFTCLVRLAVFPLAQKSFRSFARMRKIQPEMAEIREKFGDDRAKLQEAIFALYKKENVNPMAGCLPLAVQIPIFFALYKTLYINIDMRHAPFFGWIKDMSAPDPLSVATLFGHIHWDPPQLINIGVWPIIMGLTLFMQQRMQPPAQDPTQARILSFMPVMMTLLMAHFPAGLVIYWSWSNTLSIIQQYVLMRHEGVEVHFFRRSAADRKMAEAVAHGPNVHPAAEEVLHDLEAIDGDVIEKTITPPAPRKKR